MQLGLKKGLRFGLARKLFAIGIFALVLVLALFLIGDVIEERQGYRNQVAADIAASWTGRQQISGPIIVAPYKITKKVEKWVYENGTRVGKSETVVTRKAKYFLPDSLNIDAKVDTEFRYRGIYRIPVYSSGLSISAAYELKQPLALSKQNGEIEWGTPYLVFAVRDIRGINQTPQIKINGQVKSILPGTNVAFLAQGVRTLLKPLPKEGGKLNVDIALSLQGMEKLSFLPTGKSTKVSLASSWPHPSFVGRFLPKTRQISDDGFSAVWETTYFSSNMAQEFSNCAFGRKCSGFHSNEFGVVLQSGVDVYLQSDRAIKYAILFIGLTFVAFLIFEVLKDLRIHPIQYGLVGFALALFYLLLLSLSEHTNFVLSYLIAALACVGLIGFYVSHVLRSATRGLAFAGGLAGLYGALFVLIGSEDYALIMGSGLVFVVLAFIMVVTRNVDWHAIGERGDDEPAPEPAPAKG